MPRSATKYDRIASALKKQILAGDLKPGDVLPSYRDLMAQHGVAVATVRQALGQLQASGLVKSVQGKGCVVAATEKTWDMIGIALIEHGDSRVMIDDVTYLQKTFETFHCDISLRIVHPLSQAEINGLPEEATQTGTARRASRLTQEDLDGFVAWARRLNGVMLCGQVSDAVINPIRGLGLNCVVVGYPADRESIDEFSMVTVDVKSIFDMAVNYLVGLGHRRIMLVSGEGSWYCDKLASCFNESMRLHGLEKEARKAIWYSGLTEKASFATLLRQESVPPTAILVEEAVRADSVLRDLIKAGYKVPEQISVMAISETSDSAYIPGKLTSVVTSTRSSLLRATEIMLKLLHSSTHTVFVEKLAGSFQIGKTCGAPPK